MIELPNYAATFWITAVLAVILVGIAKAGFEGEVGVITTPLMALTIPIAIYMLNLLNNQQKRPEPKFRPF